MNVLVRNFLAADRFAVVGASTNRTKFGNKVSETNSSKNVTCDSDTTRNAFSKTTISTTDACREN